MDFVYPMLWFVIFVFSATVHEAAHAWAAKRGGDPTAYLGGQVSLDPLPHIKREPFGMVIFPLVSVFLFGWPFGYASSPYDPTWAYNNPRKAAWMSAAGPAANLLVALLCVVIIKLGIQVGIFIEPDSVGFRHIVDPGLEGRWTGLSIFISMLFTLNLILFVLNLIPLPPLDGSHVLPLFLHDEAARSYRTFISNPAFGFIGFFLAWQVFGPLFDKIFLGVINIVYLGAGFH
ncbi:MAG: site-2 protease family protein [Chloroflexi bacterium]|nr:site-2 protease family protein [Chloroflexota bacterium]